MSNSQTRLLALAGLTLLIYFEVWAAGDWIAEASRLFANCHGPRDILHRILEMNRITVLGLTVMPIPLGYVLYRAIRDVIRSFPHDETGPAKGK